ncbi:MAG: DNA translocase FtsK, partial [Lachnospiraceae bacterium]|nr:DNA translocase FtsK [Lachnospiraceae bacterium]
MASADNKKNTTKRSGSGRTSQAKKNSSARRSSGGAENQKEVYRSRESSNEIKLIVFFAIALIMLLSVFNMAGSVGRGISYVLFGLFGRFAYAIPFVFFLGATFIVVNRNHKGLKKKIAGALLIFAGIMTLIQLIDGIDTEAGLLRTFSISATYKTGGGIIGGTLAYIFKKFLGHVVAVLLSIIMMMIGLVLIAQKAIFGPLFKKGGGYAREKAREGSAKRAENQARRKEEREEQRRRRQEEYEERRQEREERQKDKELFNVEVVSGEKKQEIAQSSKKEDAVPADPFDDADIFETPDRDESRDRERKLFSASPKKKEEEPVIEVPEPLDQGEEFVIPYVKKEEKQSAGSNPAYDEIALDVPFAEDIPGDPMEAVPFAKSGDDGSDGTIEINEDIPEEDTYILPPTDLLKAPVRKTAEGPGDDAEEKKNILQMTFDSFGVEADVVDYQKGPTVTRFEVHPHMGVKVSKIQALQDDIKLNLAVTDVRIEAPIPGKAAVGIEVPNSGNNTVTIRELIESREFSDTKSKLAFAAGRDIGGNVIIADIAKMPHLLIAGSTGSGKSVCINSLIVSLLYRAKPSEVKLVMIDPKVVELNVYNGLPHLLTPVVTDPKKAASALAYAVSEMTDRYRKFAEIGVKDITGYNERIRQIEAEELESEEHRPMPQIVVIIDELADLMMVSAAEVEASIIRLTQLARAAGIHLVIATQRPSVNVITGLIKANVPSRIAFAVASAIDSRVILDMSGAEKLLGKGDMLYYPQGLQKPLRVQGAFIDESEVQKVVDFIKSENSAAEYDETIGKAIEKGASVTAGSGGHEERDVLFPEAGRFIIKEDKASIGKLQRVFKIGFNRAARIMDQLYEAG